MSEKKESVEKNKSLLLKALDFTYEKAVNGFGENSGCKKLAEEYLEKNNYDKYAAARHLAKMQILKCTTTGFLTGLGGLITLPITIPADLAAVWFMQLNMIAAIAVMGGQDPKKDEVKAICYACLVGKSGIEAVKRAGIEFTRRGGFILVNKIPSATIKAINAKIGMRFITKGGEKGIINLWKAVPVLGGFVGGAFDLVSTSAAANLAIKIFLN